MNAVGSDFNPLLVEVVNALVRSEKYPEHRNKYIQLKKRRGHKKSYYCDYSPVACGNLSYSKKNEQYDSTIYHYQEVGASNKKLSIQETVQFSKSHGFQVV
ncbi:hypothetical protein [Enterococcus casseliflavus]|uniref:hypothetical protein n=1 Tax=Enterococcus casseliflavus TaxID=37734 RepID=UPI0022E9816D|nr:hypothetical protein [Enterococcus casseliflavus]